MLAPTILLETSIAQLTTLASFLAEQMGTAVEQEERAVEARACKELLLSISVLLPKLHAAKYVLPEIADQSGEGPVEVARGNVGDRNPAPMRGASCRTCDE
jgi:hypothetical protein